MSLDIKYRPHRYADVLGQDAIKDVIRQFVMDGKGFQQSYLFAGPHGSGKTTLGRILARALLCENPVNGEPCDQCESCVSLLEEGTSADFSEVDAATNSGKADIKKLLEEIAYTSFSGKRRVYLFDESHQLSKEALDALLKPLEETLPGSADKRLVCIFCTTEPERMRHTIISRCAPVFHIHPLPPDIIAERLATICEQENIPFEPDVLPLVAEITESHIRDALKAVEGVSMLGPVNRANVTSYLHLDLNSSYLDVLESLGKDLPKALQTVEGILKRTSPARCYERLAEVSMLAYQVSLGVGKPPAYWDRDRLLAVGHERQAVLLGYASRFSSRPGRPSASMLACDLSFLHHGIESAGQPVVVQAAPSPGFLGAATKVTPKNTTPVEQKRVSVGTLSVPKSAGECAVAPDFAKKRDVGGDGTTVNTSLGKGLWCRLLGLRVAEQDGAERGPTRRHHMDRS